MGTLKVNGAISATGTISASSFLGNASVAQHILVNGLAQKQIHLLVALIVIQQLLINQIAEFIGLIRLGWF